MTNCTVCGKEYKPAKHHYGLYCSQGCYHKSQLIENRIPQLLDKEWLEEQYEKHSYNKIAKMLGCGETIVFEWCKKHGIESKTRKERLTVYAPLRTPEHLQNISEGNKGNWSGEKNPRWQGGVRERNWADRGTSAANSWRLAVKRKAGGACQRCGRKSGQSCPTCNIPVPFYSHHIKPWSQYPELRFDTENGEYLCFYCHKQQHTASVK
jgi:hypothetical protein